VGFIDRAGQNEAWRRWPPIWYLSGYLPFGSPQVVFDVLSKNKSSILNH
jgi:hypothetical protein